MKQLFFAALIIAAFSSCKKDSSSPAQQDVTLTANDVATTFASGKTVNYVGYNFTGVVAPANARGQSWDFSTLTELSGASSSDHFTKVVGDFPSATYSLSADTYFATGEMQKLNLAFEVSDSGWCRLGAALPAFTIEIPAYGAELVYAAQSSSFNKKLPLTPPLPFKFGDAANFSGVVRAENFTVNAAAFGLSNTPGAQTFTSNGYAQCWATGKITLKGYDKQMNAMVVKVHRKTVYNYLLGGAPAPKTLLDLLGLTDGDTYDNYWYDFYSTDGQGYLGTIIVNGSDNISAAYFKKP